MNAQRTATTTAGLLFIVATGATMLSQMLIGPILESAEAVARIGSDRDLFLVGVLFEISNALASAGIAIAFFPILRRCIEGLAVAYVGFRVIEGAVGLIAAVNAGVKLHQFSGTKMYQ